MGKVLIVCKKNIGVVWKFLDNCVSLPTVTTNQRCIGHQSSMKCGAVNWIFGFALFGRMGCP